MKAKWPGFFRGCSRAQTTVLGLLLLSLGATPLSPQTATGTISGAIKDASGAALAGAKVTVVSEETGATGAAVTNGSGEYKVPSLPIGRYQVKAELAGFKTQARSGINLTAGQDVPVDFPLEWIVDWTVFVPDGESKDLLVRRCFVCHDLQMVVTARGDSEFWQNSVTTMIANGADIPAEEMELLVKFLSSSYGPGKPRLGVPIHINTAGPDLLGLLAPLAGQADAIVKARAGAPFRSVDDLLKVKGMTREKLNQVRPFLSAQ